jgi:hypothetical protein
MLGTTVLGINACTGDDDLSPENIFEARQLRLDNPGLLEPVQGGHCTSVMRVLRCLDQSGLSSFAFFLILALVKRLN